MRAELRSGVKLRVLAISGEVAFDPEGAVVSLIESKLKLCSVTKRLHIQARRKDYTCSLNPSLEHHLT